MKTLFALLFSLPLYAGTTATLLLKGTVPPVLEVSVTPETSAALLPLEQSQTSLKVATINERSNNNAGYSVNVSSVNQGKLKNGTNLLPYSLTYNGNSVNLVTGQTFSHSFTNAAVKNRDVSISYNANENLPAGDYTDTLTFTITGN